MLSVITSEKRHGAQSRDGLNNIWHIGLKNITLQQLCLNYLLHVAKLWSTNCRKVSHFVDIVVPDSYYRASVDNWSKSETHLYQCVGVKNQQNNNLSFRKNSDSQSKWDYNSLALSWKHCSVSINLRVTAVPKPVLWILPVVLHFCSVCEDKWRIVPLMSNSTKLCEQ